MNDFHPKLEILPPTQRALWSSLTMAKTMGLVLCGGTAIGLRLGHWPSINFDFFTSNLLNRAKLNAAFPFIDQACSHIDPELPPVLRLSHPLHSPETASKFAPVR